MNIVFCSNNFFYFFCKNTEISIRYLSTDLRINSNFIFRLKSVNTNTIRF